MMVEPDGPDNSKSASTSLAADRRRNLRGSSLLRAIALLLSFVGFPALLWSWFEYTAHGVLGMVSVALPAVVCAASATVALVLTSMGGGQRSLGPLFASIMARTFFPMAACMALMASQPSLAEHGLLWKFLAFYLLTLTAETLLAVVLLNRSGHGRTRVATSPHHGYR